MSSIDSSSDHWDFLVVTSGIFQPDRESLPNFLERLLAHFKKEHIPTRDWDAAISAMLEGEWLEKYKKIPAALREDPKIPELSIAIVEAFGLAELYFRFVRQCFEMLAEEQNESGRTVAELAVLAGSLFGLDPEIDEEKKIEHFLSILSPDVKSYTKDELRRQKRHKGEDAAPVTFDLVVDIAQVLEEQNAKLGWPDEEVFELDL